MPDTPDLDNLDGVDRQALDAAMAVFDRVLHLMAPHRHVVAEALTAAHTVYAEAEDADVERMLAGTEFHSIKFDSAGGEIRYKHARVVAAQMVAAFDELCRHSAGENYAEWEQTLTDPALEEAIERGDPQETWPPGRKYRFIVVRPGGKSPHELRQIAERDRITAAAAAEDKLEEVRDRLSRIGDFDTEDCDTLDSAIDYVTRRYQVLAAAEVRAADEVDRLRGELNRIAAIAAGERDIAQDPLEEIHAAATRAARPA